MRSIGFRPKRSVARPAPNVTAKPVRDANPLANPSVIAVPASSSIKKIPKKNDKAFTPILPIATAVAINRRILCGVIHFLAGFTG